MKNERGISLIALIITIIVIIILAAIVIGSVLNAPDEANFAKYCQDYSEIQSAVSTQAAVLFGQKAVSTDPKDANYSMTDAYKEVCKGSGTEKAGPDGYVQIVDGTKLGLSSLPSYVKWYVNTTTGQLVSGDFSYEKGKYNTPNGELADFTEPTEEE